MSDAKLVDDPLVRLLQGYPGLRGVLEGRDGGALQAELTRLLRELCPPRSARKSVAIIAKLLRSISGCQVEESVIVHDISESGLRVTLPVHLDLSLAEAMSPAFVLRIGENKVKDGPRELRVQARCVRLLGMRDSGVELAYTFTEVPDADIYKISQWVKPRVQNSARPGRLRGDER
jgi:hypothetical protein